MAPGADQQDQARSDLEQALRAEPDNADVAFNLAVWDLITANGLTRGGDRAKADERRAEALKLTGDALAHRPDDPVRMIDHARILLDCGKRDEAIYFGLLL